MINWNTPELMTGRNQNFLNEAAKDLAVQIVSVKDANNTSKAALWLTYKILAGIHAEKTVSQIYFTEGKALFRLRNVAIACSRADAEINDLGETVYRIHEGLQPKELVGCDLVIDAEEEIFEGKRRIRANNERPFSKDDF